MLFEYLHCVHGHPCTTWLHECLCVEVTYLSSLTTIVLARLFVLCNIYRLGWERYLHDRDELTDLNTTFLKCLCDIYDECVEGVSHLLNLVQKGDGFFSLYTAGIAPPHHVMTAHDLVKQVTAWCLIRPVVRLDQHRPGKRAEQLSVSYDLILDAHELRCRNHIVMCLASLLSCVTHEPVAWLADAV